MFGEVTKIGSHTYIASADSELVNLVLDTKYDVKENFDGQPNSGVVIGTGNYEILKLEKDGQILITNPETLLQQDVKIYLAKYRRGSCDWNPVIFYQEYDGREDIILDFWEVFYINDNYVVYRMASTGLPETLPQNGNIPDNDLAPFVQYERYFNIYDREQCIYLFDQLQLQLVDFPGSAKWDVRDPATIDDDRDLLSESNTTSSSSSSGSLGHDVKQCVVEYIKDTPVGCDQKTPNITEADLDQCPCLSDIFSSSSLSSTSSSSDPSSLSSLSSSSTEILSTLSSESSSESSVQIKSPQDLCIIYVKIEGYPFTAKQYVFINQSEFCDGSSSSSSDSSQTPEEIQPKCEFLVDSSSSTESSSSVFGNESSSLSSSSTLEFSSSSELGDRGTQWLVEIFNTDLKTKGFFAIYMNNDGNFSTDFNIEVQGIPLKGKNLLLTNMTSENFRRFPSVELANMEPSNIYLKGVAELDIDRIETDLDLTETKFKMHVSFEPVKKTRKNNAIKKDSEIVFDFEREQMIADSEAPNILLYMASTDPNNTCRAFGSFCLENVDFNRWEFNESQKNKIQLTQNNVGGWQLKRTFRNSSNEVENIYYNIDNRDITNNDTSSSLGFSCLTVVSPNRINSSDPKCITDTYIAFMSDEDCDADAFNKFQGDLFIKLSNIGEWQGGEDYQLSPIIVTNKMALWAFTDGSETAMLSTADGLFWKLNISLRRTGYKANILHEFYMENVDSFNYEVLLDGIGRQRINNNGVWNSNHMSILITGEDPNE